MEALFALLVTLKSQIGWITRALAEVAAREAKAVAEARRAAVRTRARPEGASLELMGQKGTLRLGPPPMNLCEPP